MKTYTIDKIIDALYKEGLVRSSEPIFGNSYHCSGCSCWDCKFPSEDYCCVSNDILKTLRAMETS